MNPTRFYVPIVITLILSSLLATILAWKSEQQASLADSFNGLCDHGFCLYAYLFLSEKRHFVSQSERGFERRRNYGDCQRLDSGKLDSGWYDDSRIFCGIKGI